jgi:hypothetical protein
MLVQDDAPSSDNMSYATLVCRIAPGSALDLVNIVEYDSTDTP